MAFRRVGPAVAVLAAALALAVPPAYGTFPGPNGKIAFSSDRSGDLAIWVMNPDGSAQERLTGPEQRAYLPAWAPHGRDIAFVGDASEVGDSPKLYTMDAEGGSVRNLGLFTTGAAAWSPDATKLAYSDNFRILVKNSGDDGQGVEITQTEVPDEDFSPDWSPDGETVVFSRVSVFQSTACCPGKLIRVDPDGNAEAVITSGGPEVYFLDLDPSISPDGKTVAFSRQPLTEARDFPDIYTVPIGGGTPSPVTNTPQTAESDPVWSPDGTKIAFTSTVNSNSDIYVIDPDGTDQQRLTTDPGADFGPSWRGAVVPGPGYPRPKSAATMRISLVPAFRECTDPNRTHGPPLGSGSCSPPEKPLGWDGEPGHATVGTPDANGHPAQSTGYVRFRAIPGDLSTEPDEADVRIKLQLTDVRDAANPSTGYASKLAVPLPLRLTDRRASCCGTPGTVKDVTLDYQATLQVDAPCAPAGAGVGSTCGVTTTYDTLIPGLVREGARSVWQLTGPVQVYDSGSDNYAPTNDDNAVVATQGVFVP